MSEEVPEKLKQFIEKFREEVPDWIEAFYDTLPSDKRDYESIKEAFYLGFYYSIKSQQAEIATLCSLEDEFYKIIDEYEKEHKE